MRGLAESRLVRRIRASAGATVLVVLGLAWVAYTRPWYFTNQTYLGGLILVELLAVAVWKYRQVFFALLIIAFLLAGSGLPSSAIWTSARWLFLAVGAVVGLLIILKDQRLRFGMFHTIAFSSVLAAAVSVFASRYSNFALLKVLSLLLLFLYAASGARLAATGREKPFFEGLLLGCEILVGSLAISHLLLGTYLMGNPNSLGAIIGVVAAPVILWGALATGNVWARRRRQVMFTLSMYLLYFSHSRASMVAAVLSCGLLCIGLRRYRALIAYLGAASILLSMGAILQPERLFDSTSSLTTELVYKGPRANGLFASRHSPWQDALDAINSHFWFGTGFGTTDKRQDAVARLGNFSSSSEVTSEFGNSYLEITSWVGVMGVLPFFLLLLILAQKILRTVSWMRGGGNPSHPAIPLAMVVFSGFLHAAFEDWMFAPGYYLCVFYWCIAFLLIDFAPHRVRVSSLRPRWVSRPAGVVAVATGRDPLTGLR
jgi:O-antigen ligase